MVSYGPWQQDPDYLQWHTIVGDSDATDPVDGLPLFDYGTSSFEAESGWQDPVFPITDDVLEPEVLAALAPPWATSDGGSPATVWGTVYSWNYTLSTPNWNSSWGGGAVRRGFRITQNGSYFYAPWNYVPIPPGAIGIDWDDSPYDPSNPWRSGEAAIQTRHLSHLGPTRFRGHWIDDTSGGLPENDTQVWLQPLGGGALVIHTQPPPAAPSDGANPINADLPASIDLTPYIAGTGWSGRIWTRQTAYVPPDNGPEPYTQGTVRYGWGFDDVRIDTMVRPARYRWVFEGEEPPSYRRTYPRDDTRRNYPRPRAHQSSNRTSGGYL